MCEQKGIVMDTATWRRRQEIYPRKRTFWLYVAGVSFAVSLTLIVTLLTGSTTLEWFKIVGVVSIPTFAGAIINYLRYVFGKPRPVMVTLWTLGVILLLVLLDHFTH